MNKDGGWVVPPAAGFKKEDDFQEVVQDTFSQIPAGEVGPEQLEKEMAEEW